MELYALQAFVEVARQGSFSAAAQRLFLTQPAVSKRIAALERELDSRLFDRIGRQVSLTEAGRALLPAAERLLNDAADLRRLVSNLSGEVSGPLLLGTSHHVGLHRLPPVLRQFHRSYPEVRLDIRFMDSEAACAAVGAGALELAVVTLPEEPPPNLALQTVWEDPLHFVVGRDHALAGRRHTSLARLAELPAVLPSHGTFTRGILERAVAAAGLELQIAMATNYLETLKMLAATGLGWSLLPTTLLDDSLHALQVRGLQLSRRLGLVLNRQRTLSNAARCFMALCEQARETVN
jgi:DNA-binding transcriptional LysR family regulator